MANISISVGVFSLFIFQIVAGAALDAYLSDTSCETTCEETFPNIPKFRLSCIQGCRLFKIICLAKGYSNKTVGLCSEACSEAFVNKSIAFPCKNGCHYKDETQPKNDLQTIHLLTPLFYVKSAYNSIAQHVREFVSASMTVYVEEDTGNMVVLESKPKIERIEDVRAKLAEERHRYLRNFKPPWEEDRVDWVDCIARQSGLPKFLLVLSLLGSIILLIWLCCSAAVTAPHHYVNTSKMGPKNNLNYVLVCEPNEGEIKCPPRINLDEDAPPLPPKVSLI